MGSEVKAKYVELKDVLGLPDRVKLGGVPVAVLPLPWAKEAAWAEAYDEKMAGLVALERELFIDEKGREIEMTAGDRRVRQHRYDATLRKVKAELLREYFGGETAALESACAVEIEDAWEVVLARVFPTVAREEMQAQTISQNLMRALAEGKNQAAKTAAGSTSKP